MPAKLSSLQALILCGPGSSFPTFTANPDEHPKALLSIANRPMVWYALQYCYRMGVRYITLICPPSAEKAITSAMNRNPHLTSLPSPPKPAILAPQGLDYNTSTANILRHPEVRAIIKTDFLVLPCDIVCEVPGDKLWDAWVNLGVSLPAHGLIDGSKPHAPAGLSVWYDTKGVEPVVKGEETDFAALAPLPKPARPPQSDSLQRHVSRLVYAMPKDTLLDLTGEQGGLSTRHGLMRAHPKLNMKSTLRDAHIYLFPHWIVDFVVKNERLETIGEDVLGWWAKAGWMPGLDEKLHVPEILAEVARKWTDDENSDGMDDLVDSLEENKLDIAREEPPCPPILAYVHPKAPAGSAAPIIRRVDTAALLLNVSLQLAKRPSYEEAGRDASPYAHPKKVAYPEGVKSRTTITQADSLVAEQVIVEEKVAIKESVVGANCTIREGAKITRCVLMDGVEVGKFARLTGCILGRRCRIGQNSNLTDCEVQENLIIEEGTEEKGEALRSAQGLEPMDEEINAVDGDGDAPF